MIHCLLRWLPPPLKCPIFQQMDWLPLPVPPGWAAQSTVWPGDCVWAVKSMSPNGHFTFRVPAWLTGPVSTQPKPMTTWRNNLSWCSMTTRAWILLSPRPSSSIWGEKVRVLCCFFSITWGKELWTKGPSTFSSHLWVSGSLWLP